VHQVRHHVELAAVDALLRRAVEVELHQFVAPPSTSIVLPEARLTCTVWPLSMTRKALGR